jgi:ornithine cyclodeaminase
MEGVLAALARDELSMPLRFVVRPPGTRSLMGFMPAHRGGTHPVFTLKEIVVSPRNPERGLDPHQGGVLVHDGETGELRALLNASAVTEIRTAAVSAVATKLLAPSGSRTVAILGAGVQARSHAAALRAVLPDAELRIWARRPEAAAALASEVAASVAGSAEEALAGAQVVCTTTSAREPILEHRWLEPGAHVNAVGSSVPSARELDAATVAASAFFVDRRESTLSESGDYLLAVEEAGIGPEHIRAELGELLTGAAEGRRSNDELTVFKSLGIAVEDLAAAELCVQRALASGIGAEVEF